MTRHSIRRPPAGRRQPRPAAADAETLGNPAGSPTLPPDTPERCPPGTPAPDDPSGSIVATPAVTAPASPAPGPAAAHAQAPAGQPPPSRPRSPGGRHNAGHPGPARSRLRLAMLAVGVVGFAAAALGIGIRAIDVAHAAVDEPQYLLTAVSLGEDGSLDIADELADQRWRAFADVAPPVQTRPLAGGRQVSPHDPLLPLVLALPVRVAGWLAAKWTLAVLAGVLAAATLWLAVRRFGVRLRVAGPGVALAAGSAPLAVYGQQVYPELPAALLVVLAAAALTGPLRRGGLLAAGLSVAALPWLSVKYVPVAAALAAVAAVRLRGRRPALGTLAGCWLLAAASYLLVHRALWGGWTVYASGGEFARSGEFGAVGFHPDYPGRSIRLAGLLVDRGFGLAAWQPAYLLAVPALAALLATRPRHWPVLAAPLAAGWLNATYIAVTMHGYWWPGRQVVVVLPLVVVLITAWADRLPPAGRLGCAALALTGVLVYARVLAAGWAHRTTWVHAPDDTWLRPLLAQLLPDDRVLAPTDYLRLTAWTAAGLLAAVTAALAARHRAGRHTPADTGS